MNGLRITLFLIILSIDYLLLNKRTLTFIQVR